MRNWYIGTGFVVGAGVLIIPLKIMGLSYGAVVGICTAVAIFGFLVQVSAAFRIRSSFKRDMEKTRQQHNDLMERAKKLPPAEAISLLLGKR